MTRHDAAPDIRKDVGRSTFALCFAVAMIDGFDTLIMSFIAPALATAWRLDDASLGPLFAAGLVGAAIGALASGLLADRIGRRPTLLLCVLVFGVTTLACAAARSVEVLVALRLLGGLGLGGAIPAITALTAEQARPDRRAASVTLMFIGFPVGAVVGGALSAGLVGMAGWPSAFVVGGAAPLVLLPLLWSKIQEPKAWTAVHAGAASPSQGVFDQGRGASGLFLLLAAFLILLLGYFLISWTPMMLSRAGLADGAAALGAVVLNLGGIAGAFLMSRVFVRFGTFRTVAVALGLGALLVAALGRFLHLPVAGFVLIFLTGAMVIGAQLNLPAMAAELFPVRLRGSGVGATMAAGRLGSILGPIAGAALLGIGFERHALFAVVAGAAVIGGAALLAVLRFRREEPA